MSTVLLIALLALSLGRRRSCHTCLDCNGDDRGVDVVRAVTVAAAPEVVVVWPPAARLACHAASCSPKIGAGGSLRSAAAIVVMVCGDACVTTRLVLRDDDGVTRGDTVGVRVVVA